MNKKTNIILSGLPGKMANLIAEGILNSEEFDLLPMGLTGEDTFVKKIKILNKRIKLYSTSEREKKINLIKEKNPICVDYTSSGSVKENVQFYCEHKIPFVMGTTGFDSGLVKKIIEDSDNLALIAPNMAREIVVLQAMFDYAAKNFPGIFNNYFLKVSESHQKSKADKSGTAKHFINCLKKMGAKLLDKDFVAVRDLEEQKRIGIPENFLDGHAWHRYCLESPDKTVGISLEHKVNGRNIYVNGTFAAIRFLREKVNSGISGKIYSMLDVLK
jgi:4-hydroxy-tetrahydrodipicolinate reductase